MGGLPSQNEIEIRQNQAQTQLANLKKAHDDFVSQWEKIFNEQQHLMKDLHRYVDTTKIEHMLSVIKNIQE